MSKAVTASGNPQPKGWYSAGYRAPGRLLFVAGQGPIDAATGEHAEDLESQARQVLMNIDHVARAAGASITDAVKITLLLGKISDVGQADLAFRRVFGSEPPARTLIQTELGVGGVAMDAIIALPRRWSPFSRPNTNRRN